MSQPQEWPPVMRELARERISEALDVLSRTDTETPLAAGGAADRGHVTREFSQTALARLSDASELLSEGEDDRAVLELLDSADTLLEAMQDELVTMAEDFEVANGIGECRELIDRATGLTRWAATIEEEIR